MIEFETKQQRIQALLKDKGLDTLLIRQSSNFAWATCGARSYVNVASSTGAASLLIAPHGRYLITNTLEAARLEQEERLGEQGWDFQVLPWYAAQNQLARLTSGLRLGADGCHPGAADVSADLVRLRIQLTPEEGERMRLVCRLCTEAIESAARSAAPGQSEHEVAARLAFEAERRGVQAITNIVASDGRIAAFRHALPTEKRLERLVMLVLCGRRWGLVGSVTRFVHFGPLPEALRRDATRAATVAAQMLHVTRPGRTVGDLFEEAMAAYAGVGCPEGWQEHHQGGTVAYEPREYLATAGSREVLVAGQAFVWNPSVGNVRSVDTFLVGERDNEVLTGSEAWPSLPVEVAGRTYLRPGILEVV